MGGKPRTNMKRFWDRVDKTDECWNWTGFRVPSRYGQNNGYGLLRFAGHKHLAHRLAYLFTYGTVPEGLQVCHRCDNPACCNPDHLFLGTQKDNLQDASKKKRLSAPRNHGESCGTSKLKEADVMMIRERYATGSITQKELGEEYGVGQDTISTIINHKTWGWLM